MYTRIELKSQKERPIERGHNWVFSGAIKGKINIETGTLVDVYSSRDAFLGTGHYSNGSIAVRLISKTRQAIDFVFWKKNFEKAWAIRSLLALKNEQTNCFRLIHGEGDGLPGLIIDIYNTVAVVQAHTLGMYKHLDDIAKALMELPLNLRAVYSKSNRTVTEASLTDGNHFIIGDQGEEWALENDLKFKIDFEQGQKTGFFLDQRDNRALLGSFSQGKKVLNAFSYTGGFSLYALRAGAKLVHSVDISGRAIEVLEENVAANFNDAPHESFVSDVSAFLKESTEKYDLMIVDPPAFAKRLNKRHKAVIGYKNLNHRVFKAAQPNSLIATFSCSQAVDETLFTNTITAAAIESGRKVKLLKRLGQGADHPVDMAHQESHYLKGLLLFVE